MAEDPPRVYILHGDDEFLLASAVAEIEARLGDASLAEINVDRIDGRTSSLEDVRLVVGSLPMFVTRRLVIVTDLITRIGSAGAQEKLVNLLGNLPATTVLVLLEHHLLKDDHWLLVWARNPNSRANVRLSARLKNGDLLKWIDSQVARLGGKITPRAAGMLVSLVGEDTRVVYNELQKLLAYVGYQRTIEPEDVEIQVLSISQADIFGLVDAVGSKNARAALAILRKLCATHDHLYIFSMIVRQVRLVMLAKEILSGGKNEREVAQTLHLQNFVAGKISRQARNFSLESLEETYRRLLSIDVAGKTGRSDWDVAMESLVLEIR